MNLAWPNFPNEEHCWAFTDGLQTTALDELQGSLKPEEKLALSHHLCGFLSLTSKRLYISFFLFFLGAARGQTRMKAGRGIWGRLSYKKAPHSWLLFAQKGLIRLLNKYQPVHWENDQQFHFILNKGSFKRPLISHHLIYIWLCVCSCGQRFWQWHKVCFFTRFCDLLNNNHKDFTHIEKLIGK